MSFRLFPSLLGAIAPSRVPRALAVVLFGLQALLWGGGSIVEARSAAESLTRYSHVEDQGTTACPPMHSHLDCLICRTLASGALAARARDLLDCTSQVTSVPDTPFSCAVSAGCNGPLGSRAPPGSLGPDRPIA